jgi:hypothetical protein
MLLIHGVACVAIFGLLRVVLLSLTARDSFAVSFLHHAVENF